MAWSAPKHPNGISGGKKQKKTNTTITRKDGSQASGYISGGKTYYSDGSRIGTGDSVTDVSGRQWTMGSNGAGVLTGYAEGSRPTNPNSPGSGKYNTNYGYSGGSNSAVNQIDYDYMRQMQAKKDALIAELTGQYNTNMSNLDKTYGENKLTGEKQLEDVKAQYMNTLDQLDEDAYNAYKLSNQRASQRGLTSSAQGEAMLNTVATNTSKQRADINTDRNKTVNDIQTQLNRLSENYGIDRNTLEANFGADKLKAMSQAELEAIQMKLDVDKYNTDWQNKYKMQDYQNQFTAGESAKDRQNQQDMLGKQLDVQKYIANMDNDTKLKIANLDASTQQAVARISANGSMSAARYSAQLASSDQAYANRLGVAEKMYEINIEKGMSKEQAFGIFQKAIK